MRERLFARLDAVHSCRCIWLWAPAGAGKTSLVSSWVEARRLPCAWYQVDPGDGDPATLFHYLRLVVSATAARRQAPPKFTPECLPGLELFSQRFFEAYFRGCAAGQVLVFDNCQETSPESFFPAALAAALRSAPPGTPVICLSRQAPPATLARWQMEGGLRVLDSDDLRLTDAEAQALARGSGIDDDAHATQINLQVRGWAAGVKLLLQASGEQVRLDAQPDDKPQLLFDYLAAEVFSRMDAATQKLLLRTAQVPAFPVALAVHQSGLRDAGMMLARLYADRLFIDRRTEVGTFTYEYHPLFRGFLQHQGQRQSGADDYAALQSRAAQWLYVHGDPEGAAALALAAADWPLVVDIVRQRAAGMLAEGRIAALEALLVALPVEIRADDPWLMYWLGACRSQHDVAQGRADLEAAYRQFLARGDRAGAFLSVSAILAGLSLAWGKDGDLAVRWAKEFDGLLADCDGALPPDVEVPILANGIGLMNLCVDHPLMPKLAARAAELAPTLANLEQRYGVGSFCMNFLAWRGEFARAHSFASALMLGSPPPHDTATGLVFELWRGLVLWQLAEHEAAEALLESFIARADQNGIAIIRPHLYLMVVFSCLSRGDLDATERALELGWPGPEPWFAMNVQAFRMMHAVTRALAGHTVEGAAAARDAHALAGHHFSEFSVSNSEVLCGHALLLNGEHEEARLLFERSLAFGRRIASYAVVFQALMPLAWSHLQTGERDAGLALLREALAIAGEQEFRNCHPVWVPRMMSDLCATALEHGIEPDYVRRLIRWRKLAPPADRPNLDDWPWPIRIHTLGRFAILLDDVPLQLPPRAPKKPLELLKALIALGGRGVAIDALSQHLWPDQEGDAARNALGVALHRLRKFLGNETAVTLYEGKLSLDQSQVWVDAWAVQRIASVVVEMATPNTAPTAAECEAMSSRLLRIYLGHFIAGEDDAWALPYRERLRGAFHRACKALGAKFESAGCLDKAIELQRRVIAVDPVVEQFHRDLMANLDSLGRRSEVADAYRYCRQIMTVTLGTEPSAQTRAIYERIRDRPH